VTATRAVKAYAVFAIVASAAAIVAFRLVVVAVIQQQLQAQLQQQVRARLHQQLHQQQSRLSLLSRCPRPCAAATIRSFRTNGRHVRRDGPFSMGGDQVLNGAAISYSGSCDIVTRYSCCARPFIWVRSLVELMRNECTVMSVAIIERLCACKRSVSSDPTQPAIM
jgi:hypothetical protein